MGTLHVKKENLITAIDTYSIDTAFTVDGNTAFTTPAFERRIDINTAFTASPPGEKRG